MAQVNSQFTYNSNFDKVFADLKNLAREATAVNSVFSQLNKSAAAAKMAAAQTFAAQAGAAGFHAQIVNLNGATENFGQQLMKNKLTMREYFREASNAYKKDSKARILAEREVRRAQGVVVGLGDIGGQRKGMLLTPQTLDMKNAANRIAVANKQYEIFNHLVNRGATELVNWGKNTQWAGRQLTVGLTVPIAIFSGQALKAFAAVDKEITRFRKVYGSDLTGTVQESTDAMIAQIKAMGSEFAAAYGIASSQTMALAADLAATGLEGDKLAAAVNQTTRLMVLGEVDRQQAMQATLSIQTAFKQNTEELAASVDFLNAVENSTSASLQDLTEAIPKTGPVIQALGGDIKDLAVLMTALREGGIASGEGANAIKSGMASLIAPTKQAIDVARQFGIDLQGVVDRNKGELMPMLIDFQNQLQGLDDFGKARVIEQIFGKYQFARISALFANLNQQGSQTVGMIKLLDASRDDLAKKSYSELKAQERAPSTRLAAAQQKLTENLIKVGADLAETLLPIFDKALAFLQMLIDGFNNLPAPVKNFAKIIAGVATAAGPILMLAGIFGNLIGNTIKFGMSIINMFKRITGNPVKQLTILTDEEMAAKLAADQLTGAYHKQKVSVDALNKSLQQYIANLRMSTTVAPPGAIIPGMRGGPKPPPPLRRQSGGVIYAQNGVDSGGRINGYGGGDTVPALLEPGEFVINKKSSRKYAPLLRDINRGKDIPGFMGGTDFGVGLTRDGDPMRGILLHQSHPTVVGALDTVFAPRSRTPFTPRETGRAQSLIQADSKMRGISGQDYFRMGNPGGYDKERETKISAELQSARMIDDVLASLDTISPNLAGSEREVVRNWLSNFSTDWESARTRGATVGAKFSNLLLPAGIDSRSSLGVMLDNLIKLAQVHDKLALGNPTIARSHKAGGVGINVGIDRDGNFVIVGNKEHVGNTAMEPQSYNNLINILGKGGGSERTTEDKKKLIRSSIEVAPEIVSKYRGTQMSYGVDKYDRLVEMLAGTGAPSTLEESLLMKEFLDDIDRTPVLRTEFQIDRESSNNNQRIKQYLDESREFLSDVTQGMDAASFAENQRAAWTQSTINTIGLENLQRMYPEATNIVEYYDAIMREFDPIAELIRQGADGTIIESALLRKSSELTGRTVVPEDALSVFDQNLQAEDKIRLNINGEERLVRQGSIAGREAARNLSTLLAPTRRGEALATAAEGIRWMPEGTIITEDMIRESVFLDDTGKEELINSMEIDKDGNRFLRTSSLLEAEVDVMRNGQKSLRPKRVFFHPVLRRFMTFNKGGEVPAIRDAFMAAKVPGFIGGGPAFVKEIIRKREEARRRQAQEAYEAEMARRARNREIAKKRAKTIADKKAAAAEKRKADLEAGVASGYYVKDEKGNYVHMGQAELDYQRVIGRPKTGTETGIASGVQVQASRKDAMLASDMLMNYSDDTLMFNAQMQVPKNKSIFDKLFSFASHKQRLTRGTFTTAAERAALAAGQPLKLREYTSWSMMDDLLGKGPKMAKAFASEYGLGGSRRYTPKIMDKRTGKAVLPKSWKQSKKKIRKEIDRLLRGKTPEEQQKILNSPQMQRMQNELRNIDAGVMPTIIKGRTIPGVAKIIDIFNRLFIRNVNWQEMEVLAKNAIGFNPLLRKRKNDIRGGAYEVDFRGGIGRYANGGLVNAFKNMGAKGFFRGGPALLDSMFSGVLPGYRRIAPIGGRSTSRQYSGILRRSITGEDFAFKGYRGKNSALYARSQSQMNNILKEMGFNVPESSFGAYRTVGEPASYIKTRNIKNLQELTPDTLATMSIDDLMELQALEAMSNSTDAHLGQMMLVDGKPVFLDRGRGMISQAHGAYKGFISNWSDRPTMLQALRANLGLDKSRVIKHSGADALRFKIRQENLTEEQVAELLRKQFTKGLSVPEEELYARVAAGETSAVGREESMALARTLSGGTSDDLTRVMIQRQRQEIEEVLAALDDLAKEFVRTGMNYRSSDFLKGDYSELAASIQKRRKGGIIFAANGMTSAGKINGYGGGDTVPALLEPGEFVINKESSAKYAPLLRDINRDTLPGFTDGLITREKQGGKWIYKNPDGTQTTKSAYDKEAKVRRQANAGKINRSLGGAPSMMMNALFLPMMFPMIEASEGFTKQIMIATTALMGFTAVAQAVSAYRGIGGVSGAVRSFGGMVQNAPILSRIAPAGAGMGSLLGASGIGLIAGALGTAVIGAAAYGIYRYIQNKDENLRSSASITKEATEAAKVYNIDIRKTQQSLRETQREARSFGYNVSVGGKGALNSDFRKAVTESEGDLLTRLSKLDETSQKQERLNSLTQRYASLIMQGFSPKQAKEWTAEIARQAGMTSEYSLLWAGVLKNIKTVEDALIQLSSNQGKLIENTLKSFGTVEEGAKYIKGTLMDAIRSSSEAPIESAKVIDELFDVVSRAQKEGGKYLVSARTGVRGLLDDLGFSDNFKKEIKNKNAKELKVILQAIAAGIKDEEVLLEPKAVLKPKVRTRTAQNAVRNEVIKMMEAAIAEAESQIERTNKIYDKRIEKIQKEAESTQDAHEKKMKALEDEAEALQDRADLIDKNASKYIEALQKEYEAEQYYTQQRQTGLSGLSALSKGDIFGFVEAQMQQASDAQQFGREQAISQIEDTRDTALEGIEAKLKLNQKARDAAQDNLDKAMEASEDQIEKLNRERSKAIKQYRDFIAEAQAIIDNPSGTATGEDSLLSRLDKLQTKGEDIAKNLPPKLKTSFEALTTGLVDKFDTAVATAADRISKKTNMPKEDAAALYQGLLKSFASISGRTGGESVNTFGAGKFTIKFFDKGQSRFDKMRDNYYKYWNEKQKRWEIYEDKQGGPMIGYGKSESDSVRVYNKDFKISQFKTRKQKLNKGGMILNLNNGSIVPGPNVNRDVVPAMLTPGEFVMTREATKANLPLLEAMNSGYNMGGKVMGYNMGGYVGYNRGGMVGLNPAKNMPPSYSVPRSRNVQATQFSSSTVNKSHVENKTLNMPVSITITDPNQQSTAEYIATIMQRSLRSAENGFS